jgi:RES domain-containing protein
MEYAAESISLAVLENLVHMSRRDFPVGYVALTALIPDSVRVLDVDEFRRTGEADADIGDRWIASRESSVLRVHSSVVPREHLYLLNPAHSDCDRIRIEQVEPFVFDARLLGPR